jgi:Icc-related predicted phosphoesterase
MIPAFFVSDLHGSRRRYDALGKAILGERPDAVFLGGDLLPHAGRSGEHGLADPTLVHRFSDLQDRLGPSYPHIFLILGNDDPRVEEPSIVEGEQRGLWTYAHGRRVAWKGLDIYGYQYVPPTPFLLKDWERYDVSRHVDPGGISPEEGWRTTEVDAHEIRHATIQRDLDRLHGNHDQSRAIWLMHTPPYRSALDRAALDGRRVDHAPLDVHVGSVAVRRFIETHQPLLTLHGHIHESARLTGAWRDRLGRTELLSAAHDGPELALVRVDLEAPAAATRELIG